MKSDQQTTDNRIIEVTREINAPVEAVWKALTEAKELERWFPVKANVNPKEIQLSWGGEVNWNMEIEEQQQNEYLRLGYDQRYYNIVDAHPRKLALEFFLEAHGGKTMLRIVHAGFGGGQSWDEVYDGVNRGWNMESLSLKHYLENHAGKDRILMFAQCSSKRTAEELWDRLTIANGNELLSVNGDQYVYATPIGTDYEGKLIYLNPPLDFCGTLWHLNNAMFRFTFERFSPEADISIWIWIAAYGVSEKELKLEQQRWEEQLKILAK